MRLQAYLYGWRRGRDGLAFRRVRSLVVYVGQTPAGWYYRIGPFDSDPHPTVDAAVAASFAHLSTTGLL